jgi:hypothetical protein
MRKEEEEVSQDMPQAIPMLMLHTSFVVFTDNGLLRPT